ncbi:MAG: hypothetical protein GY926_20025 [bacterium]|nr:hypothetical protein [bacterium]
MIEDISLLPFVVSIPAVVLIGATIWDIVCRPDLAGWRKAAWAAVVVVLPVVGTFIYLLSRPFKDPAHAPRKGNQQSAELIAAITAHESGTLSDDAFRRAKNDMFCLADHD